MIWGKFDIILIQIKCTINGLCLNYPQVISTIILSSTKPGSTAKHVGDCYIKEWSILSFGYFVYLIYVLSQIMTQFSSVVQSCPTLCDPMNHSTPGLPVHHQLQEFTQTQVHRVSDAIQPSHPLLPPAPPALNLSQHQWVSSSHQVAKVLELQLQHQSLQRNPRADLL